jgi:DNA-damage-inducible protein J
MAQISMRIDDTVKAKAELACEALGMNMTTAINIYLVKLGNEMRIPFDVAVDPFYSAENQKALLKSIRQLREGHVAEHEIVGVDE